MWPAAAPRHEELRTLSPGAEFSPRDPSMTGCSSGWQYAAGQSQIELCGETCDRIKADDGGQIDLIFGCETKIDVR